MSSLTRKTTAALLFLTLIGCGKNTSFSASPERATTTLNSQAALKSFANALEVNYQVIDNRTTDACRPELTEGLCFHAKLELSLDEDLAAKNWALYFSHMSPIQAIDTDNFNIDHINGDLHRLTPSKEFSGFRANEPIVIGIQAGYWHLSKSDIMPNYYLTSDDLNAEIVSSTRPIIDSDSGLEVLPHAGDFRDPDKHLKRSPKDQSIIATASSIFDKLSEHQPYVIQDKYTQLAEKIIPTPQYIASQEGFLSLATGYQLKGEIPPEEDIQSALDELARFGIHRNNSGISIKFLSLDASPNRGNSTNPKIELNSAEAYQIEVSADSISIYSHQARGAYYALRSLSSLMFVGQPQLPLVTIKDQPRYAFRGMHLDVARNFRDKYFVINLMEQMSRYKLNRLHLHLGDDEGWRVEIDDLPELTDIGSRRCHDPSETQCLMPQLGSGPHTNNTANGYYSKSDYQDILKAAKARHIEIIPSFDMPGHSRAAVIAMEARYQKLLQQENRGEAERYRLIDPMDKTQYLSVQFYNDNTLNVCLDSSYRFVDKVISEVIELHQQVDIPLTRYHIGADETAGAWIQSPACQNLLNDPKLNLTDHHDLTGYFVERVAHMIADKGIVPAGWNDGMSTTKRNNMPEAVQANAWTPLFWQGHAKAHELANRHWQVVLSIPDVTYFDFPYAIDPEERGYYWASRATDTQQVFSFMPNNLPSHAEIWGDRQGLAMTLDDRDTHLKRNIQFYGLQGHLWTETTRSSAQANYMIFPRLIALAERAWHKASWELDYNYDGQLYSESSGNFTSTRQQERQQDWNLFASLLAHKELEKLDLNEVEYRIPVPGAKIIDEQLHIRSSLNGLSLQYRIDQGGWNDYASPVAIDTNTVTTIFVRSLSANKGRASRVLSIMLPE